MGWKPSGELVCFVEAKRRNRGTTHRTIFFILFPTYQFVGAIMNNSARTLSPLKCPYRSYHFESRQSHLGRGGERAAVRHRLGIHYTFIVRRFGSLSVRPFHRSTVYPFMYLLHIAYCVLSIFFSRLTCAGRRSAQREAPVRSTARTPPCTHQGGHFLAIA